ncbi:hypothetical protein [Agromyces sp. LHK192]|uniref:hypothetical protein n=1 Tax=Agromyces sp. LHK192 TaxID=2498704 RepID=UPI000FD6DF65|nr:hypothetical protein [Agromyces sp. LHK192]
MKTVQLREYRIVEGEYEAFVEWWQATMPELRTRMGYTVEFAYGSPADGTFTWAVSVPGDEAEFTRVDEAYKVSPERAEVFDGLPQRVAESTLSFVSLY